MAFSWGPDGKQGIACSGVAERASACEGPHCMSPKTTAQGLLGGKGLEMMGSTEHKTILSHRSRKPSRTSTAEQQRKQLCFKPESLNPMHEQVAEQLWLTHSEMGG